MKTTKALKQRWSGSKNLIPGGRYNFSINLPVDVYNMIKESAEHYHCSMTQVVIRLVLDNKKRKEE